MKRLAAGVLLLVLCIATDGNLLACGDKFLVVSRGTRFKRSDVPRTPASILIYADPASNLPRALQNASAEATLRKAGYTPRAVESAEQLGEALAKGAWDLVVVDQSAGDRVRSLIRSDRAPIVLPVYYNATRAELKAARQRYPVLVDAPVHSQALLKAIDDALATRPRMGPEASPKSPA